MFTRAGIDTRGAKIILIYAKVSVITGRRSGWANLLRFRRGDLAWYCKNPQFLCWGLRANIHNIIHPRMDIEYGDWHYSDVETRREYNIPDPPPAPRKRKPQVPSWTQPDLLGCAQ